MTTTKRKYKHTPGPWHAVGYWVEVESDAVADICTCNPADISQEHLGRKDDEICANAVLIAAAPNMLAALLYVQHAVWGGEDFGLSVVNAAIAKATGGAA